MRCAGLAISWSAFPMTNKSQMLVKSWETSARYVQHLWRRNQQATPLKAKSWENVASLSLYNWPGCPSQRQQQGDTDWQVMEINWRHAYLISGCRANSPLPRPCCIHIRRVSVSVLNNISPYLALWVNWCRFKLIVCHCSINSMQPSSSYASLRAISVGGATAELAAICLGREWLKREIWWEGFSSTVN